MMKTKSLCVFSCALILLLSSCMTLNQPRHTEAYYTLEYPPPRAEQGSPLPVVLRIQRFTVAPLYNTNRMVYRDQEFTRQTYTYHRWRANPGDLVTDFLSRDLKHSGLFQAVLPRETRTQASYRVEGSVDEFLEWDHPESWKAVLALTLTLIAEKEPDLTRRILFQRTYRREEPCRERHPRAVAEAMSRAMSALSDHILRDIASGIRDREEGQSTP